MRLDALLAFSLIGALALVAPAGARGLTSDDINKAELTKSKRHAQAVILKAQVLLDRASFSVGAIDGHRSNNFANALRAFQEKHGLATSGDLDDATWKKLNESPEPVLIDYTISEADTKGPFIESVPQDYEKKSELKRLDYTGPVEMLAERFHMDEALLRALNRGKAFDKAGTVIAVANVNVKQVTLGGKAARLTVDKTRGTVRALAKDGAIIASYPASVGSEEKPAPSGTLKVVRIAHGPTYTYNPDFKFRGQTTDKAVTIAAGPNNPAGSVWIALNEKSYGIHGAAEPSKVGKVGSHGCVRMTNWDALALAKLVRRGMPVEFVE